MAKYRFVPSKRHDGWGRIERWVEPRTTFFGFINVPGHWEEAFWFEQEKYWEALAAKHAARTADPTILEREFPK